MKRIIFYNILFFFLLIFTLEILARVFNLAPLLGVSKNLIDRSSEPYVNHPNTEALVFGKKVYTDDLGFRIPAPNFKHKIGNKSILALGDSVAFGVGVEDSKSVINLLRKENKNLNFHNSSVVGYNIKNYFQTLDKHQDLDKLSEVILFFCLNDVYGVENNLTYFDENKKDNGNSDLILKIKNIKIFADINRFIRGKSVLYVWLKHIPQDASKRYFMFDFAGYKDENNIPYLKKQFQNIKKITENKNLNLHVILLPFEFQTRGDNCSGDYMLPQKIVNKILNKLEINFFDFSDNFCSHHSPSKLFIKNDPAHLSEEGHKFLAQLIKKDIFGKK